MSDDAAPVQDRPDVRISPSGRVRAISLRANRLSSGGFFALGLVVFVLLAVGAYRCITADVYQGLVAIVAGVVIGGGVVWRLRPGRLLTLTARPLEVEITTAFAPKLTLRRGPGFRAVLWVSRAYPGADPALQGLYFLDGDDVRSAFRAPTIRIDALKRFLERAAIATEVVDDRTLPPVLSGHRRTAP